MVDTKLIIFGPPGSGKGTYSSRLREIFNLEKISTGDIFREEIKKRSKLGKEIERFVKEGRLVPDEIVIEVVNEKIKNLTNFILDGYPRTIEQAEALDKVTKMDAIIKINVHDEILIEKIAGRRICSNPECASIYNIADIKKTIEGITYVLPPILPKNDMKCDKCGSPLIQREDDRSEVIRERLKVYEKQSKPVLEHYRKSGLQFIEVWMNRPLEEIVEKIVKEINKLGIT